jgi:hypothetical protein
MILRLPWPVEATTFGPRLMVVRRSLRGWRLEAVIAHEQEHQVQMLRDGYPRYVWTYLTDGRSRAEYECQAYAADVLAYEVNMPVVYGRPATREYWIHHFATTIATGGAYTWLGRTQPIGWCEARLAIHVTRRETNATP